MTNQSKIKTVKINNDLVIPGRGFFYTKQSPAKLSPFKTHDQDLFLNEDTFVLSRPSHIISAIRNTNKDYTSYPLEGNAILSAVDRSHFSYKFISNHKQLHDFLNVNEITSIQTLSSKHYTDNNFVDFLRKVHFSPANLELFVHANAEVCDWNFNPEFHYWEPEIENKSDFYQFYGDSCVQKISFGKEYIVNFSFDLNSYQNQATTLKEAIERVLTSTNPDEYSVHFLNSGKFTYSVYHNKELEGKLKNLSFSQILDYIKNYKIHAKENPSVTQAHVRFYDSFTTPLGSTIGLFQMLSNVNRDHFKGFFDVFMMENEIDDILHSDNNNKKHFTGSRKDDRSVEKAKSVKYRLLSHKKATLDNWLSQIESGNVIDFDNNSSSNFFTHELPKIKEQLLLKPNENDTKQSQTEQNFVQSQKTEEISYPNYQMELNNVKPHELQQDSASEVTIKYKVWYQGLVELVKALPSDCFRGDGSWNPLYVFVVDSKGHGKINYEMLYGNQAGIYWFTYDSEFKSFKDHLLLNNGLLRAHILLVKLDKHYFSRVGKICYNEQPSTHYSRYMSEGLGDGIIHPLCPSADKFIIPLEELSCLSDNHPNLATKARVIADACQLYSQRFSHIDRLAAKIAELLNKHSTEVGFVFSGALARRKKYIDFLQTLIKRHKKDFTDLGNMSEIEKRIKTLKDLVKHYTASAPEIIELAVTLRIELNDFYMAANRGKLVTGEVLQKINEAILTLEKVPFLLNMFTNEISTSETEQMSEETFSEPIVDKCFTLVHDPKADLSVEPIGYITQSDFNIYQMSKHYEDKTKEKYQTTLTFADEQGKVLLLKKFCDVFTPPSPVIF